MYFIDTHTHIDMLKKLTPEEAVARSESEGVKYIINVGSSLQGSRKSVEFAGKFSNVFASVGVHPHYVRNFGNKEIEILESLLRSNPDTTDKNNRKRNAKVVAVGETGFDFYRNLSPGTDMVKSFRAQIELALKYDVPVIIHDRDAHSQTLEVIKKYTGNSNFRAVIHCFSGDTNFAMQCLDLGLYISFTGVITFPNAKSVLETVEKVPIERLFIETDAPFLAPQIVRGKENYPGYVRYVAEKIAEIKNLSIEEVADITSKNAEKFFSLNQS
ncbi:MAG: TatD family hydrolase [Actinomycetota bacterium]|nr:TatD family hydrolase [Actinomycetota bacterium]